MPAEWERYCLLSVKNIQHSACNAKCRGHTGMASGLINSTATTQNGQYLCQL